MSNCINTKKCRKCGEEKGTNEFGINNATKDKLSIYCKKCLSDKYNSPESKEKKRLYGYKYRKEHKNPLSKKPGESVRKPIRIGEKFNKLTVISEPIRKTESKNPHSFAVECQCDCGNKILMAEYTLRHCPPISCGCSRPNRKNYIKKNQTFGSLTVLIDSYIKKENNVDHRRFTKVKCECGEIFEVAESSLSNGQMTCKKCHLKNITNKTRKHNSSGTRLYRIWQGMKNRCYRQKEKSYRWYGAKGIKIYEKWKNDFAEFKKWAIENGYEDTLTIDRIDPKKDYEPLNCRWVTKGQNSKNQHIYYDNMMKDIKNKNTILMEENLKLKQRLFELEKMFQFHPISL